MKIDYKKLRKVHEDDNHTVLQHSRGHTIKIAHNALSPENLRQLKEVKMWGGGQVKQNEAVSEQDMSRKRFEDSMPGNAGRNRAPTAEEQEAHKDYQRKSGHQNDLRYAQGGMVQHFKDGGEAQQPWDVPQQEENMSRMPQSEELMPPPLAQGASGSWTPNSEQSSTVMPTNPQLQQIPNPSMPSRDQSGVANAISQQQQGIRQEAVAIGQQGKQEAAIAQQQMDNQQKLMQDFDAKRQSYMQEIDTIRKDRADEKINPNHFISNMSAPSKVAAAIGLILGGIGSGITGGENPALAFLNHQIDRDIQGQQMEMDKKKNMLSALNMQFGNLKDATNMARAIQLDHYKSQLDMAAASSKDPIAKARGMMATGSLEQQKQMLLAETARRQAVIQGVSQGSMPIERAVPELVPKEHQAKVFDELGKAQDAVKNEEAMLAHFDNAAKQNTILRRVGHLGAEPASIDALNNLVLPLIHDAEGRVSEFEQQSMHNLFPKPGDFDSKIVEKRKAFEQFIRSKQAAPTAAGYGIPVPRPKAQGFTPRK